jgi:putative SOS response-associated peptidase YedK
MCGRYWVDSEEDIQEMRAIINEIVKKYADTPQLSEMKTGEIYPTNTVAVVGAGGPELMRWGFPLQGKSIINARSETAFERPMLERACFPSRRDPDHGLL